MVMECLQDQLVSTGDPYNDDPIVEDQMEYLSEYLLTKAQKYIEAERFHSAFELVWACVWRLEYGAGHVYPRKCSDKTFQQSWTNEAEDLLVAAASGMRSAWTPAKWAKQLDKWQDAERYDAAFGPGDFFEDSFPELQTLLVAVS